jgi:hypothetical protein
MSFTYRHAELLFLLRMRSIIALLLRAHITLSLRAPSNLRRPQEFAQLDRPQAQRARPVEGRGGLRSRLVFEDASEKRLACIGSHAEVERQAVGFAFGGVAGGADLDHARQQRVAGEGQEAGQVIGGQRRLQERLEGCGIVQRGGGVGGG